MASRHSGEAPADRPVWREPTAEAVVVPATWEGARQREAQPCSRAPLRAAGATTGAQPRIPALTLVHPAEAEVRAALVRPRVPSASTVVAEEQVLRAPSREQWSSTPEVAAAAVALQAQPPPGVVAGAVPEVSSWVRLALEGPDLNARHLHLRCADDNRCRSLCDRTVLAHKTGRVLTLDRHRTSLPLQSAVAVADHRPHGQRSERRC